MKIGIITTIDGYPWAGSEELWYRVIKHNIENNGTVQGVIPPIMFSSEKIKSLISNGGQFKKRPYLIHRRLTSLYVKFVNNVYRDLLEKCDVTIVSLGSILDLTYIQGLVEALLKCNNKFILLLQFNSDHLQLNSKTRSILQNIYTKSSAQVFVSNQNLEIATRQLAMNFNNASVIYNPIKLKIKEPFLFHKDQHEEVTFGCVARFENLWKGFDVLFKVFSEEQWSKRNWSLNLYGSGPDENYIRQLINFYKLEDKVTIHGQVKDINKVWEENDVKVLVSRAEGIPLAVLEAMICGKVVVTTDVGGNCEIIEHNSSGFISAAPTVSSFSKTLEEVWSKKPYWKSIGQKAHETTMKIHEISPENKFLKICNTILEG